MSPALSIFGHWRYLALLVGSIWLGYLPYLVNDFGFHNDFTIWEYDNKICCSGFPENSHLINIGRFLQAYLQGFYLSFFSDLHSLAYGRAFGVVFASAASLMLASIALRSGLSILSSVVFGAGAFLLPPAQVNLSWVTNFIPGLFNAVVVLGATFVLPAWSQVSARERFARARLGAASVVALTSLFIYPPTIGFLLLPALMRYVTAGNDQAKRKLEMVFALAFFAIVCTTYFFLHRIVFMKLWGVSFPAHSFYRFDVAQDLLGNVIAFFVNILPVMLNLWNPAPSLVIGALVFAGIVVPNIARKPEWWLLRYQTKECAISIGLIVLLFCAMNAPGLLAIGRPPAFYRTWHPGTTAILFLAIYTIDKYLPRGVWVLLGSLMLAVIFAFNSSLYAASTLGEQFAYAVTQIHKQFEPDRERYVIVERRLEEARSLLGLPRWGEWGFLHVLPRGHAIYILGKDFNHRVHPLIENIVARSEESKLILEPELLEKSNLAFPRSPSDPINKPFDRLFDFRTDLFFSTEAKGVVEVAGTTAAPVSCYKLYAADGSSAGYMPASWIFYGSEDAKTWIDLDHRRDQTAWSEGQARIFFPAKVSDYKYYRFELNPAKGVNDVRVGELKLITQRSGCAFTKQNMQNLAEAGPFGIRDEKTKVELVGTATESGLSDPPFRLQRALDNIYYTFWETRGPFPIMADIDFFERRTIRCYLFQAGSDRANDRMPKSWRMLGSDDAVNWDVLDSRNDEPKWPEKGGLGDTNVNDKRTYVLSAPRPYKHYRIEFLSVYNNDQILRLYELALSEKEDCSSLMP